MTATIAKLVLRRFLVAIPTLLFVSILLFMVLRVLPVDPAAMSVPPNATLDEIEQMREQMGLHLPLAQQYLIWLGDLLRGDFGTSTHFRTGVAGLVATTLPATIELALMGMILGGGLGLCGGLLIFYFRDTKTEAALDVGTIAVLSLPDFLWALFLMLVFGVVWQILPFTGRLSPDLDRPVVTGFLLLDTLITGQPQAFFNALYHMILPAMALGISAAPPIIRVLRSSLLDTYQEDFIHQARLRGLSERRILLRHGLKNAILPTLSLMGVQFGFLFGGTLLVEIIFSYPGMGNLMVDAIRNTDLPIIQAVGLTYCIMVLLVSITVDSLYLILNPKLRAR